MRLQLDLNLRYVIFTISPHIYKCSQVTEPQIAASGWKTRNPESQPIVGVPGRRRLIKGGILAVSVHSCSAPAPEAARSLIPGEGDSSTGGGAGLNGQ